MLSFISLKQVCVFLQNVRQSIRWLSIYRVSASDPNCVPPRAASGRPAGCRRGWCPESHATTTLSCRVAATPSPAPIGVPPASLRPLFPALWETQGKHQSDVSVLAISAGRVLLLGPLRYLQLLWVEHKSSDMLQGGVWPSVLYNRWVVLWTPSPQVGARLCFHKQQTSHANVFTLTGGIYLQMLKEAITMRPQP